MHMISDDEVISKIRLRSQRHKTVVQASTSSLGDRLEDVVQECFLRMSKRGTEDALDLEGLHFLQALNKSLAESSLDLSAATLFAKPIGLFSLRLYDRSYEGVDHGIDTQCEEGKASLSSIGLGVLKELLDEAEKSVASTHLKDADQGALKESEGAVPRAFSVELLAHCLAHVYQGRAALGEHALGEQEAQPPWVSKLRGRPLGPVHPARRNAIREWHQRREVEVRHQFRHRETEEKDLHAYPIVETVPFANGHVVLMLSAPLNPNFLNDKVPENDRVNPVTFAIYSVQNRAHFRALDETRSLLRQGFARLLFSRRADLNGHALSDSSGDVSKISRFWVQQASDGQSGLLGNEVANQVFDPMDFCEAIVRKVLCRVPGVETSEIYPFDRALIFKEAGVQALAAKEDEGGPEERQKDPMEMLVLEASVRSTNPADRGAYLTRRAREHRGTHDYECNHALKKIEHRFPLYIHGHRDALILSERSDIGQDEKRDAVQDEKVYRSLHSADEAHRKLYSVGQVEIDDFESKHNVEAGLTNLFGRLILSALEKKKIKKPQDHNDPEDTDAFETVAFSNTFLRSRMRMLDRFGEDGLFFHYEHGLALARDIPLLDRLLLAYDEYLDDRFEEQTAEFQKNRYLQDSLSPDQIEELVKRHAAERSRKRKQRRDKGSVNRQSQAKVVFVSFSPVLYERSDVSGEIAESDESQESSQLLGNEYHYTMVLICDQDREKGLARLEAEKNDLKLYYSMLMRQMWMDKVIEHRYLRRKSRIIQNTLEVFLHRAKGMIPEESQREELDDLVGGLMKLTEYETTSIRRVEIRTDLELFAALFGTPLEGAEDLERLLKKKSKEWSKKLDQPRDLNVIYESGPLPVLELDWADSVIRDAFYVAMKNACEAAAETPDDRPAEVKINARAVPSDLRQPQKPWSLVVLVENTGGPIPAPRLRQLNQANPEPVSKGTKTGSTGIGVFLARYQLQTTIGKGADLSFVNTSDDRVHVRLRIPARPVRTKPADVPEKNTRLISEPYVLYVEDDASHFGAIHPLLTRLLADRGLECRHCIDYRSAAQLVDQRMPELVLADLMILGNLAEDVGPSTGAGHRLLNHVMGQAKRTGYRPPILIVTAEKAEIVLEELNLEGYTYLKPTADEEAVSRPGTLRILSGYKKDLQSEPRLKRLLASVHLEEARQTVPKTQEIDDKGCEPLTLLRKNRDALDSLARGGDFLLFGESVTGWNDLEQHLATWFSHEGILDPEGADLAFAGRYRLTNHVYLKRILLLLRVESRWARKHLGPRFRYWGLSHNLWLAGGDVGTRDLQADWLALRHDSKGPLSTLRHDLTNQWILPGALPFLPKAQQCIKACEERLSLNEKEALELRNGLQIPEQVTKTLKRLAGAGKQPAELEAVELSIDTLCEALQAGRDQEPSLESKVARQIDSLERLGRYLVKGA